MSSIKDCKICKSKKLIFIKKFNKKILGENLFGLEKKKTYERKLYKCHCGHYYNIHKFSKFLKEVYKKNYSNYSHSDIEKKFNKILSLKNKSSNLKRINFIKMRINNKNEILDVGSGMGIFPYTLKKKGYSVDCIESDKNMCNFLKKKKLKLVSQNLLKIKNLKKKYDLITFNKILEHFELNKIKKILINYKKLLKPDGKIYIEVPDSLASKKGIDRQEFYFEHYNIFSKKSLKILLQDLDFKINYLKSIYEINKKFTLRALISL
ncbi:class I SAM-dependent methyltransferase [Pelagibacterales bacterium SAG-MED39]|nr:class I SAM-dependent methyltransferase [Pelagibacterales bacterium SAG-MED39]